MHAFFLLECVRSWVVGCAYDLKFSNIAIGVSSVSTGLNTIMIVLPSFRSVTGAMFQNKSAAPQRHSHRRRQRKSRHRQPVAIVTPFRM